jgi:hypothetical protein
MVITDKDWDRWSKWLEDLDNAPNMEKEREIAEANARAEAFNQAAAIPLTRKQAYLLRKIRFNWDDREIADAETVYITNTRWNRRALDVLSRYHFVVQRSGGEYVITDRGNYWLKKNRYYNNYTDERQKKQGILDKIHEWIILYVDLR